jgi:hypothetical protein
VQTQLSPLTSFFTEPNISRQLTQSVPAKKESLLASQTHLSTSHLYPGAHLQALFVPLVTVWGKAEQLTHTPEMAMYPLYQSQSQAGLSTFQ